MFETQQNRSFSGFGVATPCTANQAAAEKLMDGWRTLWDEALRYPLLAKGVKDELWKGFKAAEAWFDDGFISSGVWCRTKEDLASRGATLSRAEGAVAVATRGMVPQDVTSGGGGGKAITLPEERVTAGAGWWGLTLGVLAVSAAAIAARRRRAGLSEVKSFRRRHGRGVRRSRRHA